MIWALDGDWESYRFFTAPINWRMESGDRLEINVNPEGERLEEPFEVADGVVIDPGSYHYVRYRAEWAMATKRMVSGQLTWWFGDWYDGTLDQIEGRVQIRPSELVIFDLGATRNIGNMKAGTFDQQLYSLRAMANVSPGPPARFLRPVRRRVPGVGDQHPAAVDFQPPGGAFRGLQLQRCGRARPLGPGSQPTPGETPVRGEVVG